MGFVAFEPCKIAAIVLAALTATVAIDASVAQDAEGGASEFLPTTFDVVDGEAGLLPIIVGLAEPGASIELLADGEVVARAEANGRGEWIAVPAGLVAGAHELTIRTTSADGRFQIVAEERVAIVIPEAAAIAPDTNDGPEPAALTAADFNITIAVGGAGGAAGGGPLNAPLEIVVEAGDTLWDLAERLYGDGAFYPRLLDANRATIPGVRSLRPGQTLIVPPLAND